VVGGGICGGPKGVVGRQPNDNDSRQGVVGGFLGKNIQQ